METTFDAEAFAIILALIGVVIMIAALISGLIERTNLPQVAVFLALGAALGPPGLGLINIGLDSPVLRVVATLSLALVLFTDAVGLNIQEVRKQGKLTLLVLGPGTLLSAGLIAAAAVLLLGLSLPAAVVIGAAIASTDPVLLRGLLRRRDIPATARQVLRLESGLNDVVVLPLVLIAMTFLGTGEGGAAASPDWGRLILDLFILGPGAGILVGLLAVATLDLIRRRIGIRRDYESLYSLGVAFAAFAAAESVHGSGFLAAFAAGLTISALDVELCDCFLEYGETTAELALLFTFVLFGSSLIWNGFGVLTFATAIFAVLVLLLRPFAFLIALLPTKLKTTDRALISWFGPRGLSTLLLILLPVFDGVPGGAYLFAVCSLVVLLSVVLHGGTVMLIGQKGRRREAAEAAEAEAAESEGGEERTEAAPEPVVAPAPAPAPPSAPVPGPSRAGASPPSIPPANGAREEARPAAPVDAAAASAPPAARDEARAAGGRESAPLPLLPYKAQPGKILAGDPIRITLKQIKLLKQAGENVIIVDARTERSYDNSDGLADGAVRLVPGPGGSLPDGIVDQARQLGLPRDAVLAVFCA
jgi:NhaP-type Na+/H+ or K+/H+ antiporter